MPQSAIEGDLGGALAGDLASAAPKLAEDVDVAAESGLADIAPTLADDSVHAFAANSPRDNPLFSPGPFAGDSIPARSSAQTFTSAERSAVNQIGGVTGCHSCGAMSPGTKSGNWILDHQPVSALNTGNAPQRLFPQCLTCSRNQGLAVANLIRYGLQ
jgi:hypothetical protein